VYCRWSRTRSAALPVASVAGLEIALARHGRLVLEGEPWTSAQNLSAWIDRYQCASLDSSEPPQQIKARAASSTVVCSNAPRCVESAQRIAPGREILADALYCEAGLPHAQWLRPKLPAAVWAAVFRVAWFCGYSAGAESYVEAGARARLAAEQLIAMARVRGPVLMVGHGIANILIARHLRALGCRGPNRPSTQHWQFSLYRMP
jgi:Histidine phosphatase superfamily (branch 1)